MPLPPHAPATDAMLNSCLQVLDAGEPETEITITVFRLLVLDLLALFQVLNQGLINILGSSSLPSSVSLRQSNLPPSLLQATSSKCQSRTPRELWTSTGPSPS
jgi:hypothetical protein